MRRRDYNTMIMTIMTTTTIMMIMMMRLLVLVIDNTQMWIAMNGDRASASEWDNFVHIYAIDWPLFQQQQQNSTDTNAHNTEEQH